tara:strand:- start:168 stop:410 length:243 start_codon:yes stop_codon:yes gene_type:complete
MKFVLTMIICSAVANQCMPPFQIDKVYNDGYDCMVDGYKIALDKTEEIGREDINESKIYIKFGCNEDQSNKTTISSKHIR